MSLADAAWPELPHRPMVLLPIGSLEQHGPHLPLDTDTVIATAVANRAAAMLPGSVQVAPSLAYGSSGEHQDFPGTVSVGTPVLVQVVIELVRSLSTWAGHVVLVNGHGGNVSALNEAVGTLKSEQHHVAWVPCATEAVDLHAGYTETSLMLFLRPSSVRLENARRGNCSPLAQLLPRMTAHGIRSVSPNGVLGNPAGANARQGESALHGMAKDVVERILAAPNG